MVLDLLVDEERTASSSKRAVRVMLSRPDGRRFWPTSAAYGGIAGG
jgi:hypothetical protein